MFKRFKELEKYKDDKENPYNFFDTITCMNLVNRKDKFESAKNVFTKLKIPAKFYITEKHKYGGKFGCFYSKYNVVKEAYDNGSETLLLFEDDVIEGNKYNLKYINECVNFMKNNKDWNIFFLGRGMILRDSFYALYVYFIRKQKYKNIFKGAFIDNHALCFSRNGMKRFLDKGKEILNNSKSMEEFINKRIFCDNIISRLNIDNSYYHKYILFYQNDKKFNTDNDYSMYYFNILDKNLSNKLCSTLRKNINRYHITENLDIFNEYKLIIILTLILSIIVSLKIFRKK